MRGLAFAAVAALVAGCQDDTISRPRADSGVPPLDGSALEPLALEAGMAFEYRAILTRRGDGAGEEQTSIYTLVLEIESVDDRGAAGESTLQVIGRDPTTTADDWMPPYDFDSWVGRLGPSLRDDSLGAGPVTAHLSAVPELPPAPTPKRLPVADTFFIDVRRIETLRAEFAALYATRQPQVSDPQTAGGSWRFALSGPDESITYYPVKTREIMLAYHPTGYLVRMDESIGDIGVRPSASCRIELISGP